MYLLDSRFIINAARSDKTPERQWVTNRIDTGDYAASVRASVMSLPFIDYSAKQLTDKATAQVLMQRCRIFLGDLAASGNVIAFNWEAEKAWTALRDMPLPVQHAAAGAQMHPYERMVLATAIAGVSSNPLRLLVAREEQAHIDAQPIGLVYEVFKP